MFEKSGHLFAHEKVLALDKAEKNISCFFQKKKKEERLIKRTLFKRKGFKEHICFCFLFGGFFLQRKTKEEKQNS